MISLFHEKKKVSEKELLKRNLKKIAIQDFRRLIFFYDLVVFFDLKLYVFTMTFRCTF